MKNALLAALALSLAAPVFADTTIRTRAESGGFRGMGAFESETLRKVQGSKAREEGKFKFTGAILGRLGKKKEGEVQILRVDLDKRWDLNPKKKTYTEGTITPQKGEDAEEPEEKSEPSKKGKDEKPTHRIKKTSFDVKKTGEKKKLHGFDTEKWIAEFVMEIEEIETKQVTTYRMITDSWLTPWTKTLRGAVEDERKFTEAYLKLLGVEMSAKDQASMGLMALQALTQAGGPELKKQLGDVHKKLSKLDGFAIRTETRWVTELPKEAKTAKASKRAEADEDDEELDVSNGVGGLLGGLAKKAAKKKAKKMADDHAAAGEGKPAFTSVHEVLEVSGDSLAKSEFEIPEGFKKK